MCIFDSRKFCNGLPGEYDSQGLASGFPFVLLASLYDAMAVASIAVALGLCEADGHFLKSC